MSPRRKQIYLIICTILFALSPYIFVVINTNIIHGDQNLNYLIFWIVITAPASLIILMIGLSKLSVSGEKKEK